MAGQIDHTLALATLGALDLVGSLNADLVTEKTWVTSMKCVHALSAPTPLAGDGPIMVGVAHGDYIDSEIESWIENLGSWEAHDLITQEISRRKVRRIGIFPVRSTDDLTSTQVLNEGRPITTKLGWQLGSGQTLRFWAYNLGSSVLTTGRMYRVQGHANLWPN